jgi:hypothetical protein
VTVPFSRRSTLFLGAAAAAACTGAKPQSTGSSDLAVIYVGFEVDSITGYHASDLERVGCRYKISSDAFRTAIRSRSAATGFDERDLKAEVINGRTKMYIDAQGIMKSPAGYSTVDKRRFEGALVPAGRCKG